MSRDDEPDERAAEMSELLGDDFGERLTQMLEAWRAEAQGSGAGTEEPAVRMWRDAMNNARISQDYTSILVELVTLVLNLLDALGRLILALIGSLQRALASFLPGKGSQS